MAANAGEINLDIKVNASGGEAEIRKFGKTTERMANKGTKSFQRMGKSLSDFNSKITMATGLVAGLVAALAAWGAINLASSFLDTASATEKFVTALSTIEGSAQKAEASMSWIQRFTASTPYELEKVTESFVKLRAYGIDAISVLPMLGDTASSMGKDLNDAVEMYADALTGEFERLKEFGVRASAQGDQVAFSWSQNGQQMMETAQKTGEGIASALESIFERFEGGMEAQSKTFEGMMSNLMDHWSQFQQAVMDSGVFDAIKTGLQTALSSIERLKRTGKLDEYARLVGEVGVESISAILKALGWLPTAFYAVNEAIRETIAFFTAMGEAAVDAIAMAGMASNPLKGAGAVAGGIKGQSWDEIVQSQFPGLSAVKSRLQNYGAGQLDAARVASERAEQFAQIGNQMEEIANAFQKAGKDRSTAKSISSTSFDVDDVSGGSVPGKNPDPDKSVEEEKARRQKQIDEQMSLERELNAQLNQLTMNRFDYERHLLDRWIDDIRSKPGYVAESEELIAEIKKAKLDEIAEHEAEATARALENARLAAERARQEEEAKRRQAVIEAGEVGSIISMAFQDAAAEADSFGETVYDITRQLQVEFTNGLVDSLYDFISGAKSAEDAFSEFASRTLNWLSQLIIKQMLYNAITKGLGAIAGGGGAGAAVGAAAAGSVAHASGGWINEMVVGIGQNTGKKYTIGEEGPEKVVPINKSGEAATSHTNVKVVIARTKEELIAEYASGEFDNAVRTVVASMLSENRQMNQ